MKDSLNMVLTKAIDLENTVSMCYQTLTEIAPLQSLKEQLKELASEEINHALLLRTGQNYVKNAPDAFGDIILGVSEIGNGIQEANDLIDRIKNRRTSLHEALQQIYDLEIKFVDIHLNTVADIKDETLKTLFTALSKDDQKHADRLETLMKDWGVKS
ncbi:ferritin family protein [Acidobacteriota bacterium]